CGAENTASSAFCEDCGTALAGHAASAATSSPLAASTTPNIRVTQEQSDASTAGDGERKTGRMPDRSVLGAMLAGLNRAHHHLAGIQPDANLDRRAPLLAQLACVPLEVLLHLERREQRPLRMVFVRDRRPEQREDAIPGRLRHIALVAMHR